MLGLGRLHVARFPRALEVTPGGPRPPRGRMAEEAEPDGEPEPEPIREFPQIAQHVSVKCGRTACASPPLSLLSRSLLAWRALRR